MKRFVNGEEVDVADTGAEIVNLGDRLLVRTSEGSATAVAVRQGDAVLVSYKGRQYKIEKKLPRRAGSAAANSGELRAPMPGAIVEVMATQGATVRKGDRILVLEAMKTQQPFLAPFDGVVDSVNVKVGDQVTDSAVLAIIKPT